MKYFFITLMFYHLSHCAFAGTFSQARGQHSETRHLLAVDNCRSALNIVIDLALKNCEQNYRKCQSKSATVLQNRPVTDHDQYYQGWRRICEVTATAVEADQVGNLEIGLGWGGSYCHSQSGHLNALIARLGFGPAVSAYSRCDSENYDYDIGGEVIMGVRKNSQRATSIASRPLKFKKMKECLKALHGDLAIIKENDLSLSAGNAEFSLSLFCEKAEKRGYQLSGIVSRY